MDNFTLENRSLVNEEVLSFFESNKLVAFCDGDKVFEGLISDFLVDNQYQEEIVDLMTRLIYLTTLETSEVSGAWYFELVK